jgi:outer membrane lipoprotein carrier protein
MKKTLWLVTLTTLCWSGEGIVVPLSFTSDFKQTITNTKKDVISYEGSLLFSQKEQIKWRYVKPTKKEVCTNGREMVVVDHDLEQVSHYVLQKGFHLASILAQAKPYQKEVYLARYEGKQYTIKLNAKGQLESVAYFDDLENKVQIIFPHMKYQNHTIPLKKMQCDYPMGYDMIRG